MDRNKLWKAKHSTGAEITEVAMAGSFTDARGMILVDGVRFQKPPRQQTANRTPQPPVPNIGKYRCPSLPKVAHFEIEMDCFD